MEKYLVCNLKVEDSRPACAQVFFKTSPENSGGAENSAEISGTNGLNFFCYMYESSLWHPVWVPEINVTACNSVVTWYEGVVMGILLSFNEATILYRDFNKI